MKPPPNIKFRKDGYSGREGRKKDYFVRRLTQGFTTPLMVIPQYYQICFLFQIFRIDQNFKFFSKNYFITAFFMIIVLN